MKNEILTLLKKEGKISSEGAGELFNLDLNEFLSSVKEIGLKKTSYIKREEIVKDLNTEFIGKNIYIFNEVMSTNTLAKFLAENGVEKGTVIISEKQTKGRGRSGKKWESPLGGVWLSIILSPHLDNTKAPIITLATGVAVVKTIKKLGIKNVEIKWPNDVLIKGKKVSGILAEATAKFNSIENVIIGVGIDVNLNIEDIHEDLHEKTTSLNKEIDSKISESLVIKIFLEEFEKICKSFENEKIETILKEWRKYSYSIGKYAEIKEPFNNSYEGYIVGINKEGALIIEKGDGSFEKLISGKCIIKN
jgi:BirA family biotin operon repressor/biotin-[acetyl-CoA-carboxylase] ligase